MEWMYAPWPWYVAGPVIGLTAPLLLWLGNKRLGVSSSFRHICAAVMPRNISLFQYNWKNEIWNLYFADGLVLGGWVAGFLFANPMHINLSADTWAYLQTIGITQQSGLAPVSIFSWSAWLSGKGILLALGGFLVGFGTRYARGCTSGHGILGIATFQWASLVATACAFLGGIVMVHVFFPIIFGG